MIEILPPNMRRVMRCLAVEVYEGQGTDKDPGRLVIYVFTNDGKIIGTIDPWLQDCAADSEFWKTAKMWKGET